MTNVQLSLARSFYYNSPLSRTRVFFFIRVSFDKYKNFDKLVLIEVDKIYFPINRPQFIR